MAYEWINQNHESAFKEITTNQLYPIRQRHDFGWWFAYFWKEAKAAGWKNDPGGQKLKQLMVEIFGDPTRPNMNYRQKRAAAAAWRIISQNRWPPYDERKRRILQLALEIGFKAMPRGAPDGVVQRANEVRHYFCNLIPVYGKAYFQMPIAYRGETRDPETVIQHKGAASRIELGQHNTDKQWHPFSDPTIGSKMFFRITSGDNCLYSVISVGDSAPLAVGFPLIEDEAIYGVPKKPIAQWDQTVITKAQQPRGDKKPVRLASVRCTVNGQRREGVFLATESYLYVFKVTGDAVHTQDFLENEMGGVKDQCPERGVRGVPLQDYLVAMKLRRIHLGPTRTHGVVAFIDSLQLQVCGGWRANSELSRAMCRIYHFDGDGDASRTFFAEILAHEGRGQIVGERTVQGPVSNISSILKFGLDFNDFDKLKKKGAHFGLT